MIPRPAGIYRCSTIFRTEGVEPVIDEQLSKLLDSYTTRVLNSDDKVLFAEAIGAAKASALRAAHFALWLSCIESLKRKFRELAGRDSSAGRILGEIAALDEEKRSIDSYLLEQARAYGLLSSIELTKLVHIQTMDGIYRCPYEKSPKIEEFIANASVVVDSVLCRPTRLQTSSASERAHLLAQEVLSLSRLFETELQQQKQATSQQQSLSQKAAVPEKSEPLKQSSPSQAPKPVSQPNVQTALPKKPEPCSQPKLDLQKIASSTKSEPLKKRES